MHEVSPAVSVILPAYNVTRYIGGALDSVFLQTFKRFEIIVVNDGCPNSEALERVLQQYRSRIRYVRQANTGIAGARNAGVREARAPLILNLDPDDLMEPTCLEDQVTFMQRHPQLAARYVNPVYFGGTNLDGAHWMDINPSEGDVSFRSVMAGRTCPANPGSILRRDTIIRVGWYDDTLVNSWEDFDMWLRILRCGEQISYTRAPLVRYRVREGSLTGRQLEYMEQALRVLDKAERTLIKTPEERDALERRRATVRFRINILRGKEAINQKDWPTAMRHFEFCVEQQPTAKLKASLLLLRACPFVLPALVTLRRFFSRIVLSCSRKF